MAEGRAYQLALQLVEQAARIMGAPRLIPISFAHVDACFYTGQSHIDFVKFLLEHGAKLSVPAWTNNSVASPDDGGLRHERSDPEMVRGAHELMELYAKLGCKPTWTCAPYQLAGGPKFGDHIAVGESNAVAFYNSVVGARTNKYGDYLDVACAITGLAPFAGLHTDEGRMADIHFPCASVPDDWKRQDIFFHLLGHVVGRKAGRRIPVISALPKETTTDQLKALCAQKRQRSIQIPLSCFDYETDANGQRTGGLSTAYPRLRALEAVEEAGDLTTYQTLSPYDDQVETRLCVIDGLQFVQTSMPTDEQGWGGYLMVTLRTVD